MPTPRLPDRSSPFSTSYHRRTPDPALTRRSPAVLDHPAGIELARGDIATRQLLAWRAAALREAPAVNGRQCRADAAKLRRQHERSEVICMALGVLSSAAESGPTVSGAKLLLLDREFAYLDVDVARTMSATLQGRPQRTGDSTILRARSGRFPKHLARTGEITRRRVAEGGRLSSRYAPTAVRAQAVAQ